MLDVVRVRVWVRGMLDDVWVRGMLEEVWDTKMQSYWLGRGQGGA